MKKVLLTLLSWLICILTFADGSQNLYPSSEYRALLQTRTPTYTSSVQFAPFSTLGTIKGYAKKGEIIYEGSSAQGVTSGSYTGTITENENTNRTSNLVANDTDADNDVLTVSSFTVSIDNNGSQKSFSATETATIPDVGSITILRSQDYPIISVANYNWTVPTVPYTIYRNEDIFYLSGYRASLGSLIYAKNDN